MSRTRRRRARQQRATAPAQLGRARSGDTPAYTDTQARRIIARGDQRKAQRTRRRRERQMR